ncbi:heavy-metal-associated domain-containing protein [Planctomycetota bacterium]
MQIGRRQALLSIAATSVISTLGLAAKPVSPKNQYVMYVKDMHCESCAKKVAAKLYAVPGVVKVATNIKKDFVVIVPQTKKQLSPKRIWAATIAAKQIPVKLVSPMGTFTKPPKK